MKKVLMSFILLPVLLLSSCGLSEEERAAQAAACMEIEAAAESRKASILSSETAIVKSDTFIKGETYTGTAYYISPNGSDKNSGRSPNTPFATMQPFDELELHYGDAVFFERGGLWRATSLHNAILWTGGITVSAYGEGEKPRFYGSIENGGGEEKWELAYETEDGGKIWRYHQPLTEVAGIVLNGETIVKRDIAFWNGETYLAMDGNDEPTKKEYDVRKFLEDMWCFPDLDYPRENYEAFGERIFVNWQGDKANYVTGPLYFRCDAGNPGALYGDIEFIQPYPFMDGCADDTVFDNLCTSYCSMAFTTGNNGTGPSCGAVIQNCEVGWYGGNVVGYALGTESGDTRLELNYNYYGRHGGCISANGSGITIRNNYVHHAFQEGISLESFVGDSAMTDNTVSGNLVEYCNQAIILCNWDMEVIEERKFRNLTFEDNMVLYTGFENLFHSAWENIMCESFVLQGGPCAHDGTVRVINNVFYLSTESLVQVEQYSKEYTHIFEGNTYVQTAGKGGILMYQGNDPHRISLKRGVLSKLGDESARIITVS